jgi:hypothetical protein
MLASMRTPAISCLASVVFQKIGLTFTQHGAILRSRRTASDQSIAP